MTDKMPEVLWVNQGLRAHLNDLRIPNSERAKYLHVSRTVEKLGGMKRPRYRKNPDEWDKYDLGFNDAIDAAIKIIKGE